MRKERLAARDRRDEQVFRPKNTKEYAIWIESTVFNVWSLNCNAKNMAPFISRDGAAHPIVTYALHLDIIVSVVLPVILLTLCNIH